MAAAQTYSLDEVVDQLFIIKQVDKKKYYDAYLLAAEWTWKDIFKNTIMSQQSVWQTVLQDNDGLFVNIPKDAQRVFGAAVVNKHGEIEPIFYNQRLNVTPKPNTKCGGVCGGLPSTETDWVKTSEYVFTYGGVDYYSYTWIRMLPNGDIQQWVQLPYKKYNTLNGDNTGDYTDDYNDDYLLVNDTSDLEIAIKETNTILCNLTLKPCGCPDNTPQNIELLNNHCGCYKRYWDRQINQNQVYSDVDGNDKGGVKLSQCGTQLRYKPHHNDCRGGKIPTRLLVNYQTNGVGCGKIVEVPEYSVEAIWAGIEYRLSDIKMKQATEPNYLKECKKIIQYLNPLSITSIGKIQDTKNYW